MISNVWRTKVMTHLTFFQWFSFNVDLCILTFMITFWYIRINSGLQIPNQNILIVDLQRYCLDKNIDTVNYYFLPIWNVDIKHSGLTLISCCICLIVTDCLSMVIDCSFRVIDCFSSIAACWWTKVTRSCKQVLLINEYGMYHELNGSCPHISLLIIESIYVEI